MAGYSDPDLGWPLPASVEAPSGGGLLGGGSGGGGSWLGNLFNFSGGRSTTADLYGDLFTKKQLAAIQQRESDAKMAGLLGAVNQFAAPSKFKKNWGQLLGAAGQAMLGAEGGDKAATTALGGQLTAQKIAQLRQEAAASAQYQAAIQQIKDAWIRANGAPGAAPGPPPAPPPGAPPGPPPPGPTPNAPPPNPAGNGPPPPLGSFGLPGAASQPRPFALPPGPPAGAQNTGLPAGLDPNQQFAGLLGGGPPPPFSPEEEGSLPPPDTVIPSSPGGAGLLDPAAVRLASSSGNLPFPTRADPQAEPIRWTYDKPVIDPNDPALQGPGSPFGRGPGAPQDNRDIVVPSPGQRRVDPAIQAQMMRVQAGGAPPTPGAAGPRLPPMPGGGANQPIPGIGISPQGLAILDLFAAGAGKGTPFKGLTDTYYKDPAYLGQAAEAESRARKGVELQMDPLIREQTERAALRAKLELQPKIDAAIEWAKNDPKLSFEEKKAEIDRLTEERKQVLGSNLDLTMIKVPDGQGGQIEVQGTRSQAVRAANGLAVPELGIPARRSGEAGAAITPPTGTPVLSEAEKKISGAVTDELIEMRKTARLAAPTIRNTHDLRAKLDSGMFTGLDADWSLFGAKLGDALGITGKTTQEKIANTEVYISKLGEETANLIKSMKLGPPTSDADVKFAERIAGRQSLSAAAIRELLEMRERYARLAIQQYNDEASTYSPRAFGGGRQTIPMPEPYVQKKGTSSGGYRWEQ